MRSRIEGPMIYLEYVKVTVSENNNWRWAYTHAFNYCSNNLEGDNRALCRNFLKYNFGPLVPNKI